MSIRPLRANPESGILGPVRGLFSKVRLRRGAFYRWAHVFLPLLLLLAVLLVRMFAPVQLTILRWFDVFMRLHPRPYEEVAVRVIDIDEDSLAKIGQWPWPRKTLGRLTDRLGKAGAAAIAFDMVFPEPDRLGPENDAAFARALASNPAVIGVALRTLPGKSTPEVKAGFADRGEVDGYAMKYIGASTSLKQLEKAAPGVGSITTGYETDGVIRRVPLVETLGELKIPVLAAEALRVAQGAKGYMVKGSMPEVKTDKTTAEEQDKQIAEGVGSFVRRAAVVNADRRLDYGISVIKIGGYKVPTDNQGRVWVYPTLTASARTIPAWKILDPKFDPESVKGCIIFVGTSAEGLKDLRATALDAAAPGVEVHANIVEQVLLGRYLLRKWWADYAEETAMAFFGIIVTLLLSRFGAVLCLPITLAAVGICIGGPWYLFTRKGLLFDPFFPAVATVAIYMASSIISYLKTEAERQQVKGAFSRYMSPALVDQLAKHPEKLKLGGELREMTWHFCDIRGFTTISEQFDPHGLTQFINKFLTPMTEIILKHQGVIDKYMGDCIMAFWNAPLDDPDHARHACQAALEMHACLAQLNAKWEAEAKAENRKFIPIHIGTGLNTGTCVVGNMGSDQRFDYSVLGDGVNLASRLEGQSKTYGVNIVIGPDTRAKVPDFAAVELDLIKVKGKTVPVRIYALLGDAGLAQDAGFKAHGLLHERMIEAYRAKRFGEARELLAECRASKLPLSKLYDLYEHRLDAFGAEAPPADWDGTFTATSK